jgi:pimeloyl-ACP methyl ester carboxylesterase
MTKLDADAISLQRRGAGPPVVLLHCLGVDHHFWDFADQLAKDFTLVSYDLPGHGRSPVPDSSYSIEDLSAQLAEVLIRQNIARAHVAGISLGGLIAQHFAASRPEMVDRLILIDTTPRYTDELRAMWAERAATARSAGVKALVDGLLKIWFTSPSIAADTEGVRYVRTTLAQTPGEGIRPGLRGAGGGRPSSYCREDQGTHPGDMRRRRHPELSRLGALACKQHKRRPT